MSAHRLPLHQPHTWQEQCRQRETERNRKRKTESKRESERAREREREKEKDREPERISGFGPATVIPTPNKDNAMLE